MKKLASRRGLNQSIMIIIIITHFSHSRLQSFLMRTHLHIFVGGAPNGGIYQQKQRQRLQLIHSNKNCTFELFPLVVVQTRQQHIRINYHHHPLSTANIFEDTVATIKLILYLV
jgi:hypothetical protein